MSRLLAVELRRLFSRRLVVLAMVAAVAVSGLVVAATWNSVQPMSAAEAQRAEMFYQADLDRWAEEGDEQVAQCLEQQEREEEITGQEVDFGCDQQEPQREWFIPTVPALHETLPGLLLGVSMLLAFVALVIGTTFTAAEFSTGAMSNWLTFEPRRLRVYASKVTAAAIGVVPVAVVVLGVVIGGAWVVNSTQGLTDGMTSTVWTDIAWTAARILVLAAIGALVGAALGFLLRHTAAVLGVVIGYGIVVEGILSGLLPQLAPWTARTNLSGWATHGTTYYTSECVTEAMGTTCQMTEHALGFGHSATYLLVITALIVVVSALAFRRRDVG